MSISTNRKWIKKKKPRRNVGIKQNKTEQEEIIIIKKSKEKKIKERKEGIILIRDSSVYNKMGLIQVQAKRRQSMAAITRRGERKESKVLSWAVVWWLWAWEKRKEIKINKECRKTKRKRANKIGSGVW